MCLCGCGVRGVQLDVLLCFIVQPRYRRMGRFERHQHVVSPAHHPYYLYRPLRTSIAFRFGECAAFGPFHVCPSLPYLPLRAPRCPSLLSAARLGVSLTAAWRTRPTPTDADVLPCLLNVS